MYIIVAGAGILGFYTAQFLTKKGNDVVVIEERKDRAEEITDKLDATVIKGDAKEIKMLQEAGVEEADVILAMTGSDDSNILISILAKQLGVKRALCRITHIEYSEAIFKKLGIDAVVYPELTIATQIEEMVNDPDITGFAMLDNGETEMIEFNIGSDSKLIGKKVSKIKMPKRSQIISIIRRDGKREAAFSESTIGPGDKVLVLTNKKELDGVEGVFS
jgi:trk system potassium uptake protein TrkA